MSRSDAFIVAVKAATPGGGLVYEKMKSGPNQTYGAFHDLVADDRGRLIWGGPNTHGGYGAGDNSIWRYDPRLDAVETLFPGNGNKEGWVGTDNFVRFYIPGYNWYMQNFTLVLDLGTRKIRASNINAARASAGVDPGPPVPTWADIFDPEGTLALGPGSKPYMAAHDWCSAADVGIMLGGLHSPDVATLIWKNPDYPARSSLPLRIKSVYLPQTSRHPETGGYPSEGQSCAKCRGEWLYAFAPGFQRLGGAPNKALRVHVPTFMATPADARVPDSGCEFLPDLPYVWPAPGGVGFANATGVTYDGGRDRFLIWNYEVLEFDPSRNSYAKVTPTGFPKGLAAVNCAFDPATRAHYLTGGYLGTGFPDAFQPKPPASKPFTAGNPAYVEGGTFYRCRNVS